MPKQTPAERRAKFNLARDKNKVRSFLVKGMPEAACAFAKRRGFDVFDARLGPEYKSPAEPFFVALEANLSGKGEPDPLPVLERPESIAQPVAAIYEPLKEPEFVNGWPKESAASIYALCPNPKLVVIALPDGRTASMWKGMRKWKVYDNVDVVLDECTADPIYRHVQPLSPYKHMEATS